MGFKPFISVAVRPRFLPAALVKPCAPIPVYRALKIMKIVFRGLSMISYIVVATAARLPRSVITLCSAVHLTASRMLPTLGTSIKTPIMKLRIVSLRSCSVILSAVSTTLVMLVIPAPVNRAGIEELSTISPLLIMLRYNDLKGLFAWLVSLEVSALDLLNVGSISDFGFITTMLVGYRNLVK